MFFVYLFHLNTSAFLIGSLPRIRLVTRGDERLQILPCLILINTSHSILYFLINQKRIINIDLILLN